MYNYDHDCPLEAYITNLGKYNEGELVGEWVKFPTTYEKMQEIFQRIGIGKEDEFGNVYEEWFITDYDCYVDGLHDVLGEYESLDELNYLAASIEAMDKNDFARFEAAIGISDYSKSVKDLINLTENLDKYDFYSDVHDHDDLGRMYIDEYGAMEVPDHLKNYIDYEAYGRDIALDEIGHFTDQGYVRDTGERFTEHYDGNRENIPEEYRIMSTPELSEDDRLDMTMEFAFDLDEFFRQKDPQYAAAHPDAHASKELIADLLLEGKTAAIKDRLAEMAQTPEDELVSHIGSYEQATGYEVYLDTDVPAIREKLEQDQEPEKMTVLVVEPMKEPYIKEIAPGLSAMQAEVDGLISAAYPFDDPVAIICNDEGKMNGMERNRALRDSQGRMYDIVAGPFLVTGLGDENFASLSPELAEKYMEHFKAPEMFAMINGEIKAIPVPAAMPDDYLTGEKIKTPRGSFSLTDMTRGQMEAAGYGYHHSSDDGLYHIMGNGTRAFAIVNENARTYDIYQLKDISGRRDYAFEALDRLHEQGRRVDMQNYDKVYSGAMRPGENLESIYTRFNVDHPKYFTGHSLSMSDVVVIHQNGQSTAHYCDRFGFAEVSEFFQPENYLKNAEMAMEDDFGMIDGIINNGKKEITPPGVDEKTSIRERLTEAKRECAERKPTEKKPERGGPEHDL
ncbi:antirestriction protein ArdA [Oscillibacter sp.]|uniref:antirestriction protein ArdA n=1 Tax=Oscillibacter sp. TaxID=1945593 RepID=UPI0028A0CC5A|nr:antirestriction protein ArdA [Oscillibacter sp.]